MDINSFEINPCGRPSSPGVYAIWVRNYRSDAGERHLLYIGSSKNVSKRLESMKHPYRIAYDRLNDYLVFVSFLETDDHINIEKQLIIKHKPILNKQMN